MKALFFFGLGTLILTSSLFSMGQLPFLGKDKPETPSVMYQFLAKVLSLQPYLVSETRWANSENRKRIQSELQDLAQFSKELKEVHRLQGSSFQANADFLIDDLQLTASAYQNAHFEFSRRMLKSSLQSCASCHVHVGANKTPGWSFQESQLQGSAFERAEFLLATRQFEESAATYRGLALGQSATESSDEMERAMERLLQIDLEVRSSVSQAQKSAQSFAENEKASKALKTQIDLWQTELNRLSQKGELNPKKASAAQLTTHIQQVLGYDPLTAEKAPPVGDSRQLSSYYLAGLIYQYFQANPESEDHAAFLIRLAHLESLQSPQISFNNLGQAYLRECVYRFPKAAAAIQCFERYKNSVELEFTGSGGTELPEDIQSEIKRMESLISRADRP